MCGIVAKVGAGSDRVSVQRGMEELSHRGPDGSGTVDLGWAELGHRRLTIIDTSTGSQPLGNEDNTCQVSFNGEIYNYVELKQQLISKGHQFRTESDTEVIVHAYEEWGEACVNYLRGMFAFAVADLKNESAFVARDRLGIKPLVYHASANQVLISSELNSLKALSNCSFDVNHDAVHAFLRLGYIPAPMTIYKDVFKLPPASWMRIDKQGRVTRLERYWQLEFTPDYQKSEDEWLDEIDDVIREAVRIHLRSDVDFGAFLSGGLDSSLVVAYMSEMMNRPVKTFSMGFAEAGVSECEYARQAAKICKTEHHEFVLGRGELDGVDQIVNCYGEPFGDHSALPTLKLAKMASQNVKMVLSGDGGDELFGGYRRYLLAYSAWQPRSKWKQLARKGKDTIKALVGRELYRHPTAHEHWHARARMFTKTELESLLGKALNSDPGDYVVSACRERWQDLDYQSQLQLMDVECYLPNDILAKVDIASMRSGLEVRVPLLDHKVAEVAAKIPCHLLVNATATGELQGKAILKKLAQRMYPREFVYRKKQGFGIPIIEWIGRASHENLNEMLLGNGSCLGEYFDTDYISTLISSAPGVIPVRSRKMWLLLVLKKWLSTHV